MDKNIKKRLKIVIHDLEIKSDDLYYLTGFRIEDVKTKEDFNEVIRLLDNWYYVEKYYMD